MNNNGLISKSYSFCFVFVEWRKWLFSSCIYTKKFKQRKKPSRVVTNRVHRGRRHIKLHFFLLFPSIFRQSLSSKNQSNFFFLCIALPDYCVWPI